MLNSEIDMLAFGFAACAGEANNTLATKKSVGRPRRAQFMRETFTGRAVPTQVTNLVAMISPFVEALTRLPAEVALTVKLFGALTTSDDRAHLPKK
jgi:hypothetical protein